MYQLGDRIAHPLHGAGEIREIERKRVEGHSRDYYVLHVSRGDMKVMIPVDACEQIGVRPIVSAAEAEAVFRALPELAVSEEANWNRRYRDNMHQLKSGELLKTAGVVKSLVLRERRTGLSNGERKMLHSAKQILLSEMMLALGESYEDVERRLYAALD
ncbi:MAG: CarD family transcriptional regulator [Oscillospiraceae bacterium]|nr:CarD family transcriptional regulator [Oscillospiraceae bacterium]